MEVIVWVLSKVGSEGSGFASSIIRGLPVQTAFLLREQEQGPFFFADCVNSISFSAFRFSLALKGNSPKRQLMLTLSEHWGDFHDQFYGRAECLRFFNSVGVGQADRLSILRIALPSRSFKFKHG